MNTRNTYRLIYNNDGTNILGNRMHDGRPLIPQDVYDYVDLVAGTPVTSFFICTNSSMPYYDSAVERSIGCVPEDWEVDASIRPNNEHWLKYGRAVQSLREHGTDMISLCVERARAHDLEAFASMRMNDLHSLDTAVRQPLAQGDFWLEHPEYRVGPHPGWHADGALDFAREEVRRYKLAMIEEICRRFDIDGLELDFMRFPVYFPAGTGPDHLATMTDFVRAARAIAAREGARRGRPIMLSARVPCHLDHCRWLGFDPAAWARAELVDFLTASCFFFDYPLPLATFRAGLGRDYDLPLYAALEDGVARFGGREKRTHDMYRVAAAHCHAEGADGLYLFNYFLDRRQPTEWFGAEPPGSARLPDNFRGRVGGVKVGPARPLLHELADPAKLTGRGRRYALTVRRDEYGFDLAGPLPVELAVGESADIAIEICDDPGADGFTGAVLVTRSSGDPAPSFAFNGATLEPLAADAPEAAHCHDGPLAMHTEHVPPVPRLWRVPVDGLRPGRNHLRITAGADLFVTETDLVLIAGAP